MPTTQTLAILRTELKARGFDYLSDDRCDRFINDAYKKLVKKCLWPFREASASGAAPLTVTDLGIIASVTDTANGDNSLDWRDRRSLVDAFGTLTTTGTPEVFYIEDGQTISTYPVGGTLTVKYWRNPSRLALDADVVIVPDDYADIIVDEAVRRAYIDSDNFAAANALKAEVDDKVNDMMVELLVQQAHDDNYIEVSGGEGQM